jgi:hypothetical protein
MGEKMRDFSFRQVALLGGLAVGIAGGAYDAFTDPHTNADIGFLWGVFFGAALMYTLLGATVIVIVLMLIKNGRRRG